MPLAAPRKMIVCFLALKQGSEAMSQGKILETVLLLALPASGKSEVRKFMANLTHDECRNNYHMGPTAQLDDYPYVHMMRCIDAELVKRGKERVYFHSNERPFQDAKHWGTLIELLNEDYADLVANRQAHPKSAALSLMDRMDAAAKKVGATTLASVDSATKNAVADALEGEAKRLLDERNENNAQDLTGKTIVIEFARGGAHGSALPLAAPFGYQYSLAQLSEQVLKNAGILYIWVTPEESRRKNYERTDPNDPGSILNHGVPIEVMMNDYGTDDMTWLEEHSEKPGTITVKKGGATHYLPIGRFDNRVDKTTFIRSDRAKWKPEQIAGVRDGLKSALDKLIAYKR
jgi:hypothetical protein